MSSFYRRTKHPETGQFEEAAWLDDYFGRRHHGVRFPDGKTYRQSDHQWEFDDPSPRGPVSMVFSWPPAEIVPPTAAGEHSQLFFIRKALLDLESLRDAAVCNGPGEQKLAAYLRAACKCCELALMEVEARRD